MKQIRKFSKSIALLLTFSFIFSSCSQQDDSLVSNSKSDDFSILQRKINSYNGEELFRGLFFLEGNFVNEINSLQESKNFISLNNLSEEDNNEVKIFHDFIINEIKKTKPNYFDKFKESLQNNDLYSVKQTLSNAGSLINQIGLSSEAYKKMFLASNEILSKGVNFNREDIKKLDLSNPVEVEQFFKILEEDYGLTNLKYDLSLAATCNLGIWCAVTMAVAVQSVLGAWVYVLVTKVKVFDPTEKAQISNEVLVLELHNYFNGK
jgi:hypothetical protein